MRKGILWLIMALIVLAFAVAAFRGVLWLQIDPNVPRYEARSIEIAPGSYQYVSYEFLAECPFEGGKMWVSTHSGTNAWHCYLLDIERRKVLGELFGGGPVFFNGDQSQLLVSRRGTAPPNPNREKITRFIERITSNRIHFTHATNSGNIERLWLLDMKKNAAVQLGEASQQTDAGSTFTPAPGFRYAFNKPTTSGFKPEFLLCDIEKRVITTETNRGWPAGWWDEQNIVINDTNGSFSLYNVVTKKSAPFLGAAAIADFFAQQKIPQGPTNVRTFFMFHDSATEFYLTDARKRWEAAESYLIRVERPGQTLKLVNPSFKFEWSDNFSAGGALYVYSGRESGQGSAGVYMKNVSSAATNTLLADNGDKSFSIPQLYKDSVIYIQSNMLWRVDLTGSNRVRLFPPQ